MKTLGMCHLTSWGVLACKLALAIYYLGCVNFKANYIILVKIFVKFGIEQTR